MGSVSTLGNSHHNAYRFLQKPLQKQKLHTLYPGRLMDVSWHYTGENIPPECPSETNFVLDDYANSHRAEEWLEKESRKLGGNRRIVPHPAIEPESVIEDPQLYDAPSKVPSETFLTDKDKSKAKRESFEFDKDLPKNSISNYNTRIMFYVVVFAVILVLLGCVCLDCC